MVVSALPLPGKVPERRIPGLHHPDHVPVIVRARKRAGGFQTGGSPLGHANAQCTLVFVDLRGCRLAAGNAIRPIGPNAGIYPLYFGNLPACTIMGHIQGGRLMKYDWRMTVLIFVTGIIFAITPFVRTLTNPLLWLSALIFLGLGIYRLVKPLRK